MAAATSARAAARSAEHSHPGYDVQPRLRQAAGHARHGPRLPLLLQRGRGRPMRRLGRSRRTSGPSAEPGSRAPHMWLQRSGTRLSTLDLYERTPVLLSGPDGGAWHAAGLRAAERGVPLACYRVGHGAEYDLAPEDGPDWAQLHGTDSDGAVLVRPDGFVAWRARTSGPTRSGCWPMCLTRCSAAAGASPPPGSASGRTPSPSRRTARAMYPGRRRRRKARGSR